MTFFWFRVKGQWSLERVYELLINKSWRDYFTIDIPDIVNVLTMGL